MTTISSLFVKIGADTSGVTRGFGVATAAARNFGTSITGLNRSAAGTASQIGAAFSTASIAVGAAFGAMTLAGVNDFQQIAGEVRALENQLGTTAEQASILRAQGEALGISTDDLSRGFGLFAKNLSNGSLSLEKYGITAVRTASGQVDFQATLAEVAATFQSLPEGIDQTAFAMNLFGRGGKTLLPLLRASSEDLATFAQHAREAGLIMSEEDVQASRSLAIAQRELGGAFRGISVSLARAVIPLLGTLADVFRNVLTFIRPVLPEIRDLALAFLAYKLIAFVPTLLLSIAAALETLGLATASSAVAGVSFLATGFAAVAAPAIGAAAALVLVGKALAKLAGDDVPEFSRLGDSLAGLLKGVDLANHAVLNQVPIFQRAFGATSNLAGSVRDLSAAQVFAAKTARAQLLAESQLAGGFLGLQAGISQVVTDQKALAAAQAKGNTDGARYQQLLIGAASDQLALTASIRDYTKSLADQGVKQKDVIAQVRDAATALGLQGHALDRVIGTVKDYIANLNDIPSKITTNVTANTAEARSEISRLISDFQHAGLSVSPGLLQLAAHGFHAGGLVLHEGGPASLPAVAASVSHVAPAIARSAEIARMHSGGLGPDEVPAILQRGEFVLRKESVAKIGVPALQAMNRLHQGGDIANIVNRSGMSHLVERFHQGGEVRHIIERNREVTRASQTFHDGGLLRSVSTFHHGGSVHLLERLHEGGPVQPSEGKVTVRGMREVAARDPEIRVRLEVDRKKFGRSLDEEYIARGW